MGLDGIFKSLPSRLISFYDYIYLVNLNEGYYELKEENGLFRLLNTEINKNMDGLFEGFASEAWELIKNNELIRKILKTKDGKDVLLISESIQNFKCVILIYLNVGLTIAENKKTILIADDSKMVTNFLIKAVGSEYNILVAKDGEEAIRIAEEHKNNLTGIFLDLEMPLKNGYEVLEYFQKINLYADVPVAVISGEGSKAGIEKTAAYPIVDILQKPFSIEDAKSFVEKTINIHKSNL